MTLTEIYSSKEAQDIFNNNGILPLMGERCAFWGRMWDEWSSNELVTYDYPSSASVCDKHINYFDFFMKSDKVRFRHKEDLLFIKLLLD